MNREQFDGKEPPPQPIAHRWVDFPEQSMRRMVSLHNDGTVSIIDCCPDTRQTLGAKFDIPLSKVSPTLFLALLANSTPDDQEAFRVRHSHPEQIREAAWLLGSE